MNELEARARVRAIFSELDTRILLNNPDIIHKIRSAARDGLEEALIECNLKKAQEEQLRNAYLNYFDETFTNEYIINSSVRDWENSGEEEYNDVSEKLGFLDSIGHPIDNELRSIRDLIMNYCQFRDKLVSTLIDEKEITRERVFEYFRENLAFEDYYNFVDAQHRFGLIIEERRRQIVTDYKEELDFRMIVGYFVSPILISIQLEEITKREIEEIYTPQEVMAPLYFI